MPRYFFHFHDGVDQPDHEGVELTGPEDARSQAVIATGEALKDLDGAFWDNGQELRVTVKDWQGNTICIVEVSGARRPLGAAGTPERGN